MTTVALLATGGHESGLGHVMRAASLAREAERLGLEPCLWIDGDESARQAAAREARGIPLRAGRPSRGDLEGAAALIVDGRAKFDDELAEAADHDLRTLVLDRTDLVESATWTVLPVLHAAPPSDRRIRHGATWCIVEPLLRDLAPPPYPGARENLLVCLGGSDPEGLTLRLATALAEGLPASLAPRFVVGPAAAPGTARALAGLGYGTSGECPAVLQSPSRAELYEAIASARLGLCAFGTTLYEFAALGTPALTLTRNADDERAAERLASLGIGRPAGPLARLDADRLVCDLEALATSPWPRESSARGLAALGDGRGPQRILELAMGRRT